MLKSDTADHTERVRVNIYIHRRVFEYIYIYILYNRGKMKIAQNYYPYVLYTYECVYKKKHNIRTYAVSVRSLRRHQSKCHCAAFNRGALYTPAAPPPPSSQPRRTSAGAPSRSRPPSVITYLYNTRTRPASTYNVRLHGFDTVVSAAVRRNIIVCTHIGIYVYRMYIRHTYYVHTYLYNIVFVRVPYR